MISLNGSVKTTAIWKDAEVAVKRLKVKTNRDLIDDLLKESKLLFDLQHPNIVRFIGVCIEEDNLCLVTEYMSKGSLFDIIHSEEKSKDTHLIRSEAIGKTKDLDFFSSKIELLGL